MRWTKQAACIRDNKYIRILNKKSEGKRPFGRPRYRWEDRHDIKIVLKWGGCEPD
jgi:hypothetical protein